MKTYDDCIVVLKGLAMLAKEKLELSAVKMSANGPVNKNLSVQWIERALDSIGRCPVCEIDDDITPERDTVLLSHTVKSALFIGKLAHGIRQATLRRQEAQKACEDMREQKNAAMAKLKRIEDIIFHSSGTVDVICERVGVSPFLLDIFYKIKDIVGIDNKRIEENMK